MTKMSDFIITPNIPRGDVKRALIGENHEETALFLDRLGIKTDIIKRNSDFDAETANHADMLASYLGNGEFVFSQSDGVTDKLKNEFGARVTIEKGGHAPYPYDVALNACFIGDKLICNSKHLSKKIHEHCIENGIEIIHTNQGYSKCSVCVVSENAVITIDIGIACLLNNYQIDVLFVSSKGIYLSEVHNGFIGGASALIGEKTLFFNGDIKKHPNYSDIKGFLNKHNIEHIYDDKLKLTDFGGLIPYLE